VIPVPSLSLSSTPPWPSPQYCDLGSLRDNLSAGRFHVRLPAADGHSRGVLAADFGAILDMALEVAEAVAYLHSIRLVHCDVKVGRCRAELFFAQLAVVPLCRCTPFTDSFVTPYA
jgi:serine/threonine protein kinase